MATKIFEQTDSSRLVTTAVFLNQAPDPPKPAFFDLAAEVDRDMVVVGGGATAAEVPNGALLTASYPNENRTAWLASSKDHRVPNPHRLTVFAIGMRINHPDMPRAALLSNLLYRKATSPPANHPRVSAAVPDDFTLISGGFRVNWPPGAGNLATGSFPGDNEATNTWSARSKDHFIPSPCTIDVWSIAILTTLLIDHRVFQVQRRIDRLANAVAAQHPTALLEFKGEHVLTGIGAKARVEEPGQLLWRLEPVARGRVGATASSKDHEQPLSSFVTVSALGIKLVPR
ncbi:hypothetical protein JIG36_36245 [Actinoplanes sp. LDG1-06]|uniref:Uncharacterized protein n=1 Tax=Paractinoplanes ovalisporus TaxID=2810368 RepID=A0ABS2AMD0_9ACTN|nr:hypothetical protein [Actinoplanes ovalisporus]MBM2620965.1 hypothetical protein [Actinoplanes ovalisporus]